MMALAPTRHFYPASFLDSPVRFFRYGSSAPLRRRVFYAARQQQENYSVDSRRNGHHRNPQFRGERRASNGDWIEKWSDARQPKQPNTAVEYEDSESENEAYSDGDGGGGGSTMEKIVEKLKKFGYMEGERESRGNRGERVIERGSVEDIFYYEEGRLPDSRGGFSPESGDLFGGGGGDKVKFPWEKPTSAEEDEERGGLARKKTRTSLAELTLPESELRRLRHLTFQKKHKTRISGAGVTHEVVKMIHEKWKESEIVRLKVEGAPALNMKRMHEILERKTGGLIVWRSGTSLSLYRGVSYEVPALHLKKRILNRMDASTSQMVRNTPTREISEFSSARDTNTGTAIEKFESISEENDDVEKPVEVQYEAEMDEILDTLGPRYEDWPGPDPLPVDADRLPGIVPRFQPPFRILPYGVRRSLGQKEATSLRRLARSLPPHFAIGRSRQLQGLAMAIIKLWEKSSIAKVALKRGVQLTTSERMAEEIKTLTGGVLLSRNKDFLVFYRGKNFLSEKVTEVLMERERLAESMQDEEEQARLRASAIITPQTELAPQSAATGTLEETIEADAKWGKKFDKSHKKKIMREADVMRHAGLVRKLERNLDIAERKLMKAERSLAKVEVSLQPSTQQADPESITDEERFMFRKLGLRMKAFLLLGRRGVFDGTVENMHLHWKYRELVKVVVNAKSFEQVKKVALALEAESGGVLVSVDRINRKKFAIVVFRGRDYKRPSMLRPKNLLTKRKALARSIEIQRQQALLKHMSVVQTKVDKLRSELEQMDMIKDRGDDTFYDRLDSAYGTSDEETDDQSEDDEEEEDEAYLETYEDEGEDETNDSIRNLYDDTDLSHDEKNFGLETDSDNPEFYSRNQYDI